MTRDLSEAERDAVSTILSQAASEAKRRIEGITDVPVHVAVFACTPNRTMNRYTWPTRQQFRAWAVRLFSIWEAEGVRRKS